MHFSITLCLLYDRKTKKHILNILYNNNNLFSGQIFPTWDQLKKIFKKLPNMEGFLVWRIYVPGL